MIFSMIYLSTTSTFGYYSSIFLTMSPVAGILVKTTSRGRAKLTHCRKEVILSHGFCWHNCLVNHHFNSVDKKGKDAKTESTKFQINY